MTTLKPLGAYSSTAELYRDAKAQLEIAKEANVSAAGAATILQAQLEAAIQWNHSVSVCKDHTADIVNGHCVICELEAERKSRKESERQVSEAVQVFCQTPNEAELKHDIERHVQITTDQANEIIAMEYRLREAEAVVAAAIAATPHLVEGWDEQDDPADQDAANTACEALIAVVHALAPDRTAAAQEHGDTSLPKEDSLPALAAATLGQFDQTAINAKAEALRLEGMEQAMAICAAVRSKCVAIHDGTTAADPDHERFTHQATGADECEYEIRAEIARRRKLPTEQLVADRVGLRGPHVG